MLYPVQGRYRDVQSIDSGFWRNTTCASNMAGKDYSLFSHFKNWNPDNTLKTELRRILVAVRNFVDNSIRYIQRI